MMKNSWKHFFLAGGVALLIPVTSMHAQDPADDGSATRDRQIEDMKNAFEEITESFRQRVYELEHANVSERDAALSERAAAISERDAALSERAAAISEREAALTEQAAAITERDKALAERDAAMVERDSAQERMNAQEQTRLTLENQIAAQNTELAKIRDEQSSIRKDAASREAELVRLQNALAAAQAANARERFALAYNLGNIYKAAHQYARAEAEFLKALEMNANDAALHYNMGILYDDNLENRQKAKYHYERFLALAPNDSDAPNVVKWLQELDLK